MSENRRDHIMKQGVEPAERLAHYYIRYIFLPGIILARGNQLATLEVGMTFSTPWKFYGQLMPNAVWTARRRP
jgi:hypothetical protein